MFKRVLEKVYRWFLRHIVPILIGLSALTALVYYSHRILNDMNVFSDKEFLKEQTIILDRQAELLNKINQQNFLLQEIRKEMKELNDKI